MTHYPNHLCLYLAPMSSVDLVESVDLVTNHYQDVGLVATCLLGDHLVTYRYLLASTW